MFGSIACASICRASPRNFPRDPPSDVLRHVAPPVLAVYRYPVSLSGSASARIPPRVALTCTREG